MMTPQAFDQALQMKDFWVDGGLDSAGGLNLSQHREIKTKNIVCPFFWILGFSVVSYSVSRPALVILKHRWTQT